MATAVGRAAGAGQRLSTETKQALKTTEFWAYVAILIALLVAGAVTGGDSGDEADSFRADEVWLYATLLTIGYMISRGLAKAGSRDPYTDEVSPGGDRPGLGDRVKAAAAAYRDDDAPHGSSGSEYEETGETRARGATRSDRPAG